MILPDEEIISCVKLVFSCLARWHFGGTGGSSAASNTVISNDESAWMFDSVGGGDDTDIGDVTSGIIMPTTA